jgi:putative intracellular protease/amidase
LDLKLNSENRYASGCVVTLRKEGRMADVLILVEEGYEEFELWVPYYRFLEDGLSVEIVGKEKAYAGKHGAAIRG